MTNNSKIKNSCCRRDVQEQSFAMAMAKEYHRIAKKCFFVAMALLTCWLGTIGLCVWHLNQCGIHVDINTILR